MQDQSPSNAHTAKAQYVMRKSASPAPGMVTNLARKQAIDHPSSTKMLVVIMEEEKKTYPPSAS